MKLSARKHSFPLTSLLLRYAAFFLFTIHYSLFTTAVVFAQKQPSAYPTDYFMFPIMPGKTNYMSGNMGELRPNHFHGGIDIKTQGREGLPVYASASGYVSRIKVSATGYGNALYLTHPGGYVTVYGHLKNYNQTIGNFVRGQQYAKKSFDVDLTLNKNQLPIKKGEIVGLSGNTGSSGGPHLHFEIRDTLDNLKNPLFFGFREIRDNIPPTISRLAIRTLNETARIDGEFGRNEFTPVKISGNSYAIKQLIPVWGQVGLELLAFDVSDGTSNKNGVTCMEVKLDGKEVYTHQLETLSFDFNRHINVHTDYELAQVTSQRFQRCYLADGNRLNIYQTDANRGRITIADNKTHQVSISFWDAHQNESKLTFTLKGTPPVAPLAVKPGALPVSIQSRTYENILKVDVKNPKDLSLTLFANQKAHSLQAAYVATNEATFLWDLRKGLPDSVVCGAIRHQFAFKQLIPSQANVEFRGDSLQIQFSENSLFDTLYLETSRRGNVFTISKLTIPLEGSVDVQVTPQLILPHLRPQTGIYYLKGGSPSYRGGVWTADQLSFSTRELGNFVVATDTIPPDVRQSGKSINQISCKISDKLSGIYRYTATLNGQWLLMQYDYKRSLVWSDPLKPGQPLKGKFMLEVVDNAGNTTIFETML